MSFRRRSSAVSFQTALKSLFGSRRNRRRSGFSSLRAAEQFEGRQMLALSVTGVTPADNSTNVGITADLDITFNETVLKGQGNIYVVKQSTGRADAVVDVRSADVTVTGASVHVNLPDLQNDANYSIYIDKGAFIDTSSTPTSAATLLQQDFEFAPLIPFVHQTGGNGVADWSPTLPLGFVQDNSTMPSGGTPEYQGWTLNDKTSWIAEAGDQGRSQFKLATGTVAVGDPDQFDDTKPNGGPFHGAMWTKPVDLTGVAANSIKFEFDSSFRPEYEQVGTLDVSYDGGTTWKTLLTLDPTNTSNADTGLSLNEHLASGTTTGFSADGKGGAKFAAVDNPSSGTLVFKFDVKGGNTWWWAADNLKITGNIVGTPYTGLSDPTFWNFATPESPKLSLAIAPTAISENGGVATATISRNSGPLVPTEAIVVNLAISDATQATLPATVTIPAGQSSATFQIAGIDNLLSDRTRTVTITATADTFKTASGTLQILDDEGPKVVSFNPADNATGVDYKSNFAATFTVPVRKGSGNIHIVEKATNTLAATIDVNSSAVTVSGNTVTIDPPVNLKGLTEYYVLIDDGAIRDTSTDLTAASLLETENFEFLPLQPFTVDKGSLGNDFTLTPPLGFSVDNSQKPGGSQSGFDGWSFMNKASWISNQSDQDRSRFTKGSGIVAVADSDAWDDVHHDAGHLTTFLLTKPIDLSEVTPGSLSLEFDSSYRAENPQYGTVDVSYDNGSTWTQLLFFGDQSNPNNSGTKATNDHIAVNSGSSGYVGGATVLSSLVSPGTGTAQFRFSYIDGDNNWWWAVDNIAIRGERAGTPYAGISESTVWNVTTAAAPTLTVTANKTSISENGGTAIGTVTRNLGTTGAVVVSLASSNPAWATVPATVTIPDGAASATFAIAAVNNSIADGTRSVTITGTATDFFNVPVTISVLDDDYPKPTTLSPADDSTAVPVSANFVVTYDQAIKKGNGFVTIIRASDNKAAMAIDINSPEVTISGSTLTINPVRDLSRLTSYSIRVDSGAVLSTLAATTTGVQLLSQDFELLPLGPAVYETSGLQGGQEFTATPPSGWTVDNSAMPFGGAPEWRGWTFANKNFWTGEGGQNRANFTKGTGTIAVADTDEWDDYAVWPNNSFNGKLLSTPIDLTTVAPNSVTLDFDSSFRPETGGSYTPYTPDNMQGFLDVSYDGGTTWSNLLTLDSSNTLGTATAANVDEHRTVSVPNPDNGSMVFRWTNTGTNDWWWAIDNVNVKGTVDGLPSPGITDATAWNFTTADTNVLSVAAAATATEGDAPLTGTVSRNLGTVGDVIVTLASSNTGAATVPATVTIPAGQSSVTFPITIVNDSLYNGSRPVTIAATAAGFVAGSTVVTVADNDTGDVVISEIMYNSTQSGSRDTATEWVELYNRGSSTADVSSWFLDDEDTIKWGAIPSGTTIPAGGVLVLYNGWVGSASNFRTAWNVPAAAGVVPVVWGDLDNSPSLTNEVLVVRDPAGIVRNTANYAQNGTGGWPAYVAGSSFYLNNLTGDSNVGSNWAASAAGTDFAVHPTSTVYGAGDTGSPGRVGSSDTVFDVGVGQTQTDSSTHAGTERIVKQGAGTLVLSGANSHSGGTVVTAGTLIVRNVAALGTGPVEVRSGAKLVLDVGTAEVNVASIVLANGGLIDVGAGRLTAATGLNRTSLLAAINAAKGDGSWNGTSGIGSAAVAAAVAAGQFRTLGWVSNGGSSYSVAFAAQGDTNLDGVVDIADIANFVGGGQMDAGTPATWDTGDFNHDGIVDQLDLADLLGASLYDGGNYLPSSEAPAVAAGSAVSPSDAAFAAIASESQVGTGRKKSVFAVI